jgi:hypothetical protein
MTCQFPETSPITDIPETHNTIFAAASDACAIRTDIDHPHPSLVATACMCKMTIVHIPDAHDLVDTSASQPSAVPTEGNGLQME